MDRNHPQDWLFFGLPMGSECPIYWWRLIAELNYGKMMASVSLLSIEHIAIPFKGPDAKNPIVGKMSQQHASSWVSGPNHCRVFVWMPPTQQAFELPGAIAERVQRSTNAASKTYVLIYVL
jgi:hypothetical protein